MLRYWLLSLGLAALTACGDDASSTGDAQNGGAPASGGGGTSAGGGPGSGAGGAQGGAPAGGGGAGGQGGASGPPGSLEFYVNQPQNNNDYAQLVDLPPTFGSGEFTFELWVKLDETLPTGPTGGNNAQNWANSDPAPDGNGSNWWYDGNFLLDGHDNGGSGYGTFDLQIYGEGRVRWLFNDGFDLWGVQAYPANTTDSLLDDAWHFISTVRRFSGQDGSDLELWVDGQRIDLVTSGGRPDMRQWWDDWSTFPSEQPGWFFGAEKIAATGDGYWDDYKGLIGELRFWDTARSESELMQFGSVVAGNEPGLVGWYRLDEGAGASACDSLQIGGCIELFPAGASIWNSEGPN